MNRAIARRTLFENAADIRFFLSRLALAVRRGDIEVHAYSVLTTHFHLLVRSPRGKLSLVMKLAQNEYVRRFNRERRRDGPLVRGRFRSRPVCSKTYRATLVRYIDDNPVNARLVDHPCAYPHGSARWYAAEGGPPWLERRWVEEHVCALQSRSSFRPELYVDYARHRPSRASARWIEARLASRARSTTRGDPLDELLACAPVQVLAWMRRKARLADGTDIDLSLVDPVLALDAVGTLRNRSGDWPGGACRSRTDTWRVAQVGLLRDLSACSFAEIATRVGVSQPHAMRLHRRHRLLLDEADYGKTLAELSARVLRSAHCV